MKPIAEIIKPEHLNSQAAISKDANSGKQSKANTYATYATATSSEEDQLAQANANLRAKLGEDWYQAGRSFMIRMKDLFKWYSAKYDQPSAFLRGLNDWVDTLQSAGLEPYEVNDQLYKLIKLNFADVPSHRDLYLLAQTHSAKYKDAFDNRFDLIEPPKVNHTPEQRAANLATARAKLNEGRLRAQSREKKRTTGLVIRPATRKQAEDVPKSEASTKEQQQREKLLAQAAMMAAKDSK